MIKPPKESKEVLENKRDLLIGLAVVIVIIAAVTSVVVALLPNDTQPENKDDYVGSGTVQSQDYDPAITEKAMQAIPTFQAAFRTVIAECQAVESYSDYVSFAAGVVKSQDLIAESTDEINRALTNMEALGYDEHPEIGPMIKETRRLAGQAGDCIIALQEKYGN